MKCFILNKLFGTCLLATISFSFGYAEDSSLTSLTDVDMRCFRHHASSSSSEIIPRNQVTRCVVDSINAWQVRAVYLKAGIESIIKDLAGNELFNVNQQLMQNAFIINRLVVGPGEACTPNSLNNLLNNQSELIFVYVRSLVSGSTGDQNTAIAALNKNLKRITRSIIDQTTDKNTANRIRSVLRRSLNATIEVSQNFVTALAVAPPGTEVNFDAAYASYLDSINAAEQVGRVMGLTFCNR